MMKRVTQHIKNTLKNLHQNCFRSPNEPRHALKYLSTSSKWDSSTVSDSDFDKPGSESLFIIERSPCQRYISYQSVDQKGTMKPIQPILLQSAWPKQNCSSLRASNSCNGLVLILNFDTFFLCNPATGYSAKVLTLDSDLTDDYNQFIDFGLYYDESICDYKAVVHFRLTRERIRFIVMEASLKEKRWTMAKTVNPKRRKRWTSFVDNYKVVQIDGVAVKNKLHWLISELTGYSWSILTNTQLRFERPRMILQFDPGANYYTRHLKCPPPKSPEIIGIGDQAPPRLEPPVKNEILGIGVLGGCLWVARCVDKENDQRADVEILKMKGYGVQESWTSMFVLPNVEVNWTCDTLTPLLITKNGEFLYFLHGEIMGYNLETKVSSTYYKSEGEIQVVPFVKNFDSPEEYHWDQEEHEIFGKFWNRRGPKLNWDDWRHNRLASRINTFNNQYF